MFRIASLAVIVSSLVSQAAAHGGVTSYVIGCEPHSLDAIALIFNHDAGSNDIRGMAAIQLRLRSKLDRTTLQYVQKPCALQLLRLKHTCY